MKLVTQTLHIDDCAAWDRGDLDDDEATQLTTALYEVVFEVDVETGKIYSVNGHFLGEEETIESLRMRTQGNG